MSEIERARDKNHEFRNDKVKHSKGVDFSPTSLNKSAQQDAIQQTVNAVKGRNILSQQDVLTVLKSGASSTEAFLKKMEETASETSIHQNSSESIPDTANVNLDRIENNLAECSRRLRDLKEMHPNPTYEQVNWYNHWANIYNNTYKRYADRLSEDLPRKLDLILTGLKGGYSDDEQITEIRYPKESDDDSENSSLLQSNKDELISEEKRLLNPTTYREIKTAIEQDMKKQMLRSRTLIESYNLILEYKRLRNEKKSRLRENDQKYADDLKAFHQKMLTSKSSHLDLGVETTQSKSAFKALWNLNKLPPSVLEQEGGKDALINACKDIQKKLRKTHVKYFSIAIPVAASYGTLVLSKHVREKLDNLTRSKYIYNDWIKEVNRRLYYLRNQKQTETEQN